MEKQKKSICRICGKEFTPAWQRPDQTVCNDESCRRKYGAERTAKYAKREKSTVSGRKKYALKEQKRYRAKKAKQLAAGHEVAPLPPTAPPKLTMRYLYDEFDKQQCAFFGLLQIINEKFAFQLSYEECYETGKEIKRKSSSLD